MATFSKTEYALIDPMGGSPCFGVRTVGSRGGQLEPLRRPLHEFVVTGTGSGGPTGVGSPSGALGGHGNRRPGEGS